VSLLFTNICTNLMEQCLEHYLAGETFGSDPSGCW